jgi:hypothetical protein
VNYDRSAITHRASAALVHKQNTTDDDETTVLLSGLVASLMVGAILWLAAPRALFDFCGLTFEGQSWHFVAESTSRDYGETYGVFRRHDDPKMAGIDAAISDRIADELRGTPLSQFLAE